MLKKLACGLCAIVLLPALALAQQPAPSCEDQLAQAQAQLQLTQSVRAQGEYVAADALAASRKAVTQLQGRIAELEKQVAAKAAPADKVAAEQPKP